MKVKVKVEGLTALEKTRVLHKIKDALAELYFTVAAWGEEHEVVLEQEVVFFRPDGFMG